MAANSKRDDSRYWRDKYLDLLDTHEKLENRTQVEYEQLRRGLVVTSLLAEGQSSHLDPLLRRLREQLKTDTSGLATAVTVLSQEIDVVEEQNAQRVDTVLGLLTNASDQLSKCPFPKPLIKRIKAVRQRAARDLETWSGYSEQLQGWLQILGEISSLDGNDAEPSSWWKKWFKAHAPADNETAPPVSASVDDAAMRESIASVTSGDFAQIAKDVTDTLEELLQQLIIPDRLSALQHSLQQRLKQELHWYELVPLLEDTSSFLLQCLESSQVKIEQFLHNLDQRLQAIRALVAEANNNRDDRAKARENLDQMVRDQLSEVQSVIAGSVDLKQLSNTVSDHLGLILKALENYREGEEQREQILIEQLSQLQQRLNEMEQEVQDNRHSLEEQRIKATTDSLTGLPNREAYTQRLIDEHARFHRYDTPLAIVVADVDLFKRINDTYGHLAGDKVLQLIARVLQKNIREVDFVARIGGEEFVILMPGTTIEQAYIAAEKLRKVIERSPFNFRKERVKITMSFGIAQFKQHELPDAVFERADKALFISKRAGRNQCTKAEN